MSTVAITLPAKVKEKRMNRKQTLEEQIEQTHDMRKARQVYSWEATGVCGTDTCTICGLTHHWGSGGQNTGSYSRWETSDGSSLTLARAATLDCGGVLPVATQLLEALKKIDRACQSWVGQSTIREIAQTAIASAEGKAAYAGRHDDDTQLAD